MKFLSIVFISLFFINCKKETQKQLNPMVAKENVVVDILEKAEKKAYYYSEKELKKIADSTFVALKKVDSTFHFDLKYATKNNFLKEQVYECDDCLLRFATIKQLAKANNEFKKLGYAINFFDCYRPLSIQKKMWKIYPDKRYVADPKKGSNHNRGTAVDITLIDSLGNELAMGTEFDHFGKEAHHVYQNLPKEVLENRKLLKYVMETNGFWSITSEWWHYNLNASYLYSISDFKTECGD